MIYEVILSLSRVSAIEETLIPCEKNETGTAEALLDWCEYQFFAEEDLYTYSTTRLGHHFEFTDRWEAIMFKLKWG